MTAIKIANAERVARLVFAARRPPPPLDLNAWAAAHVEFAGAETQFPGKYDPELLPFFRRPLECLGPDDPARTVAIRKSAQLGGTIVAQIFVAASLDLDPGGVLYVHPTEANGARWVRTKWWPMCRQIAPLARMFGPRQSREGGNSTLYQERRDGRGYLIISGANSSAGLSMITVRRQVQDDLSKWADNEGGDPEAQAESRSAAFRDAKILKISTPLLQDSCRITRAFEGGTQEHFHVPCPHCGHRHPLEPTNFVANISPEHPERACFTCPACGGVIDEKHRAEIVAAGDWVAHRPGAPYPSFTIWAAYGPFRSWEDYARGWLAAKGDPKAEQAFWNDVLGLAYEQQGEAPPFAELQKRGDESGRERGIVPIGALLLTLTFDTQDDFVDGALVGWGRDLRRWIIERIRVEGHIAMPECRAELTALVDRAWPSEAGPRRRADIVGIDGNAWTDDVFGWARDFPKSRVVMVRGVGGDAAPTLAFVRKERNKSGKITHYQGRFFNVGVNSVKAGLYRFLRITDDDARGYISFPRGLEADYFEQLTAEKRTPVIDRKGFTNYQWTKPRHARNEQLDVMVYAEALAGRVGWRTNTPAQWAVLEAQREVAGVHADQAQADLFGAARSPPAAEPAPRAEVRPAAPKESWLDYLQRKRRDL
jgi:phage terminase large subunit GpA-like protein